MGKKTRKNLAALEKAAFATNTLDEFQEIVDEWLYAKANYKAYVKSVALMQEAPLNVVISGVNYSKVNRKAKQGDVIAFAQGVKNKIKKGEFYEVVESPFGTIFLNEEGDELKIYTGDGMIPVVYENVYKNKDGESPIEIVEVEPVETKRKFKVGDTVRVLSAKYPLAYGEDFSIGNVGTVVGYKGKEIPWDSDAKDSRPVVVTNHSCNSWGNFEESALELVTEEEKTPNELRAEIIQRAKEFVEDAKMKQFTGRVRTGFGLPGEGRINTHHDVYVFGGKFKKVCNVEFIVNQEKHTVVALMRGIVTKKVYSKGIAKCNPDDVFNADIGKAIALGRALGKDVSEFENAVRPNELVVGMVIRRNYFSSTDTYEREIKKIEGERICYTTGAYDSEISDLDNLKIIEDTNAQYGGEKL